MTFRVYEPYPLFPPVSLSEGCRLNCRHCRGHYLDGMTVVAPSELFDYAMMLAEKGARGILVSGGSDQRGRLLHLDEALDSLIAIRRQTGLVVAIHTGIVYADLASRLSMACDVAFVDVVGSDDTAREVIGLESAVPYRETLQLLLDAGVLVTPHVTIGLHQGCIVEERAAIDFIALQPVEKMVINVICSAPGTPFESITPPSVAEIASLFEYAVVRCRTVLLGCMRPRGRPDIEQAAIAAGVRGMVLPSRETLETLEAGGASIERLPVCCGLPDCFL